jgi:hypothetical protein
MATEIRVLPGDTQFGDYELQDRRREAREDDGKWPCCAASRCSGKVHVLDCINCLCNDTRPEGWEVRDA